MATDGEARPHPRSRAWRDRWPALLFLGLLAIAWMQRHDEGASISRGGFIVDVDGRGRPTPTAAPSDEPLGVPSLSSLSDSYAFGDTQSDGVTPVAYDPCREIRVVINPRTVPSGAERVVHEALDEISAITGLRFVVEGEVSEVPTTPRAAYQPDVYGDRWAPVLIAWSDPAELDDLADDVAGIGGSSRIDIDGTEVLVSGIVALDGPSFNEFMAYPNGSELARGVVLHELGHLLGLEHVDDPRQLMYQENIGVIIPQAGDRAGLALLGQGACIPEL
jgi:hypothetical protein